MKLRSYALTLAALACLVIGSACSPRALAAEETAGALVAYLEATVPPLAADHEELVGAWAGADPVWEAAWEFLLEEMGQAVNGAVVLGVGGASVRPLLEPFPFLFEVEAGGDVRCVAPGDTSEPRFEVLAGRCATYGYSDEALVDLVAELSQPELARGRALLVAGHGLVERLVGSPGLAEAVSRFRTESGFVVEITPSGDSVEVRDGALAVCVPIPDLPSSEPGVEVSRPSPGACPSG